MGLAAVDPYMDGPTGGESTLNQVKPIVLMLKNWLRQILVSFKMCVATISYILANEIIVFHVLMFTVYYKGSEFGAERFKTCLLKDWISILRNRYKISTWYIVVSITCRLYRNISKSRPYGSYVQSTFQACLASFLRAVSQFTQNEMQRHMFGSSNVSIQMLCMKWYTDRRNWKTKSHRFVGRFKEVIVRSLIRFNSTVSILQSDDIYLNAKFTGFKFCMNL